MVDAFTFLSSVPIKYNDQFKEYFKSNYVENKNVGYESLITSGIKLPPVSLFAQKDINSTLQLEFPSNIVPKKNNSEISKQLNTIVKEIYPELDYDEIQINFQLLTNTHPLKLIFKKDNKLLQESIFIKQPSANRIIGNELYNFIQNTYKNLFTFNEEFFAMNGIIGNTLDKIDENIYLNSQEYKENMIRAFVQAKFMGLGDITSNSPYKLFSKRNLLVTPNNKIMFVDYGNMFIEDGSKFLENYKDTPGFLEGMLEVYKDEHRQISKTISEKQKQFYEFLNIIKDVEDITGLTVNQRVKKFMGSENLITHYDLMLDSYSKI